MSSQTYLTENPPLIVDTTCGPCRVYPAHASIRIDNRPEAKPDMLMDHTEMSFSDHSVDEFYYDPPHVIRRKQDMEWMKRFKAYRSRKGRTSPAFFERFGFWESKAGYLEDIKGVNHEFHRCLKSDGVLHVKISVETGHKTRCITIQDFLERMTNFFIPEPQSRNHRITRSKSNLGKNEVHWLTMKPKAISEAQGGSGAVQRRP